MGKYWDRKPVWFFCYQCGVEMDREARVHFSGKPEHEKGFCIDCWKIYFSNSGPNFLGEFRCHECKKYFDKSNFYSDKTRKFGIKSKCKKCDYKQSRAYIKKNLEKEKEYRERHHESTLKCKRNFARRERETLDDNYIRRLLARYSTRAESEFTEQEIRDKRNLILEHRKNGGFEYWQSEMEVRKTLEEIFPGHKFPSVEPIWNINPATGYRMEIDCYNKALGLAVEYNGKQHYELVEYFQDQESHEAQKQRDIEKKNNCEAKGVRLIVVPYWVEDYEKFLRESLGYAYR